LDVISGGRVDLGVGKGYRHSEFRGFNVKPGDADARFGEALDVLLRALDDPRPVLAPRPATGTSTTSSSSRLPLQSPAPADLGRGRQRGVRPAGGAPGPRPAPRPVRLGRPDRRAHRLVRPRRGRGGPAGLRRPQPGRGRGGPGRQAAFTRRTVGVEGVCAAARTSGHARRLARARLRRHRAATPCSATPDEVGEGLAALAGAGADYVLVQLAGGRGQVRRFARQCCRRRSVVAVDHQPDLLEHP
jgi:alkanesulfonate monooxygenase SsuD/methylene tetrahydromethanopterin reductase-like flavin-dependent oxidoreductase (luciferase family)